MTLRELSKLYYLKKTIERNTLRLAELNSRLQPGSMNIDGMPRNPNTKNLLEEIVPLILEAKERIEEEQAQFVREQIKIEQYIRSVEDYQIRLILHYRFVDLMPWNQVARKIGGNNTEDGVKKACYRFLKRNA